MPRLGVLCTHPIQYLAPWFGYLATKLDLVVYFAHKQSAVEQSEAGFGVAFDWDIPLLKGYEYAWLENVSSRPGLGSFSGCDTPGIHTRIKNGCFDGFLIFGWNYKSAWQAFSACRTHGVPVFMRGDSQLVTPRSLLKQATKYPVYRYLLPKFSAHLYVGERNRAYLEHYGVLDERLFFAPHCVDVKRFQNGATEARASGEARRIRTELGIPPNAFVFAFVGKLIPKKRPRDFLHALYRLNQDKETNIVHGLIIGDGELRKGLLAESIGSAPWVHWAGLVNQSELPAWYAAADALVLPSSGEETWGLVVNEAIACGLPAVVSQDCGCAPDLIDAGRTGYSFETGDVESLADALLKVQQLLRTETKAVQSALAAKCEDYSFAAAYRGVRAALDSVNSHVGAHPAAVS